MLSEWFIDRIIEEVGIFDVLKAKEDEKLYLPLYQRDAIWTEGRKCALWDSLLRGFPLPSFLLVEGKGKALIRSRKMTKKFIKALAFAAEKHKNQRRKDVDASPYINHPIALADVLANEGDVLDVETLCGAVLHDTVEDTETTEEELRYLFGDKIASIAMEVTDDKSLPKDVRKQNQIKHAPHISHEAKLVKLADKICNLRDIIDSPPKDWSTDRKQEYFKWTQDVIAGLRGTSSMLEKIFDGLIQYGNEIK